MALSLIQKNTIQQNANARQRVYQAMVAVANDIDSAEPSSEPSETEIKRRKLAQAILQNGESSDWVRSFFQKLLTRADVQGVYLSLTADNNLLSPEDTVALDTVLLTAVAEIWDSLLYRVTW